MDATTGTRLWKLDTNGSWVLGSAAVDGALLYVGTSDTNVLRAVDAATGRARWDTSLSTYVYSSPAIAGGMLYFGTCGGVLFAPVPHDVVLYIGSADGNLYALASG